jgi:hypothetical protein
LPRVIFVRQEKRTVAFARARTLSRQQVGIPHFSAQQLPGLRRFV